MAKDYDGPERRPGADLGAIVEAAVGRALITHGPAMVRDTLTHLGLDVSDPVKAQEGFAYLRKAVAREADPEINADRQFLRDTRRRCERVTNQTVSVVVKALMGGVLVMLALGAAVWFRPPHP